MAGNAVRWFEIYVEDMPRARRFYEAVFGVTLTAISPAGPELWGFPSDPAAYGGGGALAFMPGVRPGGNSTIVYFAAEDCAAPAARVTAAGGQLFKPKFSVGEYGFVALAFDTEGNLFGIHSMA